MGRTIRRTAAFTALWRALTAAHGGGPGLGARAASLPRLAWSSMRGDYDGAARFMMMGLATLYVVSPIDAVPEILLGPLGMLDDGIVVAWIVGTFLAETDRFIAWEEVTGKRGRAHRQDAHQSGPETPRQDSGRRYEDAVDGEVIP